MIPYFPRSLKSLPRKLHQQPRTIHHAKIDQRKKPFLLNTSCYRQITLQALVGKHAQYQLNCLLSDFNDMISNLRGYNTGNKCRFSSHGVRAQGTSSSICFFSSEHAVTWHPPIKIASIYKSCDTMIYLTFTISSMIHQSLNRTKF